MTERKRCPDCGGKMVYDAALEAALAAAEKPFNGILSVMPRHKIEQMVDDMTIYIATLEADNARMAKLRARCDKCKKLYPIW
jgi:uncharacterized protein with PIN domain